MKKIVVVAVLLVLGAAMVSAIGISVSLRGGYGLPTGGQNFTGMYAFMGGPIAEDIAINSAGDVTTWSNLNFSNGMGIKLLAGVDVTFLNNFSAELLGGYVLGPEQDAFSYYDATGGPDEQKATLKTSFIPLSLTAKGKAFLGDLTFFAGGGPSFALMGKSIGNMTMDDGVDVEVQEFEITYSLGVGYHGVLGIEYSLTKNLSLLFEVRGEQLTFKPKEQELTSYTVNGTDQMGTLTTSEKRTEFVDDLSDFMNSPFDPDAPNQLNAVNIYGDSINAFLGAIWRF